MRADHDRCAVIDVVERIDGLDAEPLEIGDDALVVDDLPERVRRLAGRGRLLGHVDGLAHAIAETRPLGDPDLFDGSHVDSIIPWGPVCPDSARSQRSWITFAVISPARSDARYAMTSATSEAWAMWKCSWLVASRSSTSDVTQPVSVIGG